MLVPLNYHFKQISEETGCSSFEEREYSVEKEGVEVFRFTRNFNGYETFHPFQQGSRTFALYSSDYTTTRICDLDVGKDIGGTEPHTIGFCPMEFWTGPDGNYGLVWGCVWGVPDQPMGLDLRRVSEGIVKLYFLNIPQEEYPGIGDREHPRFEAMAEIIDASQYPIIKIYDVTVDLTHDAEVFDPHTLDKDEKPIQIEKDGESPSQ